MVTAKKGRATATKTQKRGAEKSEGNVSRGPPKENAQISRHSKGSKSKNNNNDKTNGSRRAKQPVPRKDCELPKTPQYSPIMTRQLFVSSSADANMSYELFDFVESP